jgi:hypothetical protein
LAGWLAGWNLRPQNWEEIETIAIASVHVEVPRKIFGPKFFIMIKLLDQALWGQKFYMSDFNNMGVYLE